jgi:hypothetical protein
MPLLDLPNEIPLLVGDALPDKDLSSFARTSRFFHILLDNHLYWRAAQTHLGALLYSVKNGLEKIFLAY